MSDLKNEKILIQVGTEPHDLFTHLIKCFLINLMFLHKLAVIAVGHSACAENLRFT